MVQTKKNYAFIIASVIVVTVCLCLHIRQLLNFATPHIELPPFSWIISGGLACLLVISAARTQRLLLNFLLYLSFLYVVMDVLWVVFQLLMHKAALWSWVRPCFGGLVPLCAAIVLCLYGRRNARAIRVTNYSLAIDNLQAPLRVVMISDLHYGAGLKEAPLASIIEQMQSQSPDIILLCGDIYEETTTLDQVDYSIEQFSKLRATHGIYYVPGNHEYFAARQGSLRIPQLIRRLSRAGVVTLLDEALVIADRFCLAGRLDMAGGNRATLAELLQDMPEDLPVIVMDHRPCEFEAAEAQNVSLHMSGHTHAGQLFYIGKKGKWYGRSEMIYGHKQDQNCHKIVSSGVGTWGYPMRIGSHSEIVVADLTPAAV